MQYTLSMTSRMIAIAALCLFLLCVLLFLLGVELGKRLVDPGAQAAAAATAASLVPAGATPAMPAMPAAPAIAPPAMPAVPAVPAIAVPKP